MKFELFEEKKKKSFYVAKEENLKSFSLSLQLQILYITAYGGLII